MMKKIIDVVSSIIFCGFIFIAILLLIPRFMGIQPIAVLSGSMEPSYHVGSVVYVKQNISRDNIQVGDVITFNISDETMVTHRVVSINDDHYVTKGDANEVNDGGYIRYNQIVGKCVFSIPYLGYIAMYAASQKGILTLFFILFLTILITFIPEYLLLKKGGKDSEKTY